MSQINVSALTFAYDGCDNIFENVNLQIDTNWKLGLIGRNGRGKTTFLNLLLGKYEHKGTISAGVRFEYFPYEVSSKSMRTDEVIEEISPGYVQWELLRELSLLEVEESRLSCAFNILSDGEQTKVLLAVLFLKENGFLLIDEPTNHLDTYGRRIVRNYLDRKRGFILVSHDRAFIDGCIDHVLSINRSTIEVQRGNFSSWAINRERQDKFELTANEKLKGEIKRLTESAMRTANWSDKVEKTKYCTKDSEGKPDRGYIGHKSAKMMKRAITLSKRREAAIEEKLGLLKNLEVAESLKITQVSYHTDCFVAFKGVSIFYDGKAVCSNVDFSINKGERIALCGRNGSGKSSIIRLLCGENIAYSGNFRIGPRLKFSYVSQDTSFLNGKLSDYALQNGLDESLFKAILRKLDFSRMQFENDVRNFSSGQKKKVLIAKSLCEKAHLLVWDEPLNFVDIISRIQIENLLLAYIPTILFVEHDELFCEKVATKKISLSLG
ncbi:MAG: ABC-F type ribosomal protection protein [Oscillospiraceae bacterium]|jgi:lincosamide and streptogramin A transport system ATP-binding/permease protein|nr:ABC-F type ribosomal protection protein [Oscillospiraceae bacterium]